MTFSLTWLVPFVSVCNGRHYLTIASIYFKVQVIDEQDNYI